MPPKKRPQPYAWDEEKKRVVVECFNQMRKLHALRKDYLKDLRKLFYTKYPECKLAASTLYNYAKRAATATDVQLPGETEYSLPRWTTEKDAFLIECVTRAREENRRSLEQGLQAGKVGGHGQFGRFVGQFFASKYPAEHTSAALFRRISFLRRQKRIDGNNSGAPRPNVSSSSIKTILEPRLPLPISSKSRRALDELEAEDNLMDVKEMLDFTEELSIFEDSRDPFYEQILKKDLESDNEQDYDGNFNCKDQIMKDEIQSCNQETRISEYKLLTNFNQKENIVSNIQEQNKATAQLICQQVFKKEIEPDNVQDCETINAKCSNLEEIKAEKDLIDVKEMLDFTEELSIFKDSRDSFYEKIKKEIESDNEQDYDGNIDCKDQIMKDEIQSCDQETRTSKNKLLTNFNQKENIVSNIQEQNKATGQLICQQVFKKEIEPDNVQDCETIDAKCSNLEEIKAEKDLIDVKEMLDITEELSIFKDSRDPFYEKIKKEIESDNEQDYDGNIGCVDQRIKDEI